MEDAACRLGLEYCFIGSENLYDAFWFSELLANTCLRNMVSSYRLQRSEEAIIAFEKAWEECGGRLAGIAVPRDIVLLISRNVVDDAAHSDVWGYPDAKFDDSKRPSRESQTEDSFWSKVVAFLGFGK